MFHLKFTSSCHLQLSVARTCGLIFMVLDVLKPLQHKKLLEHELEGFGLRLNKVVCLYASIFYKSICWKRVKSYIQHTHHN